MTNASVAGMRPGADTVKLGMAGVRAKVWNMFPVNAQVSYLPLTVTGLDSGTLLRLFRT